MKAIGILLFAVLTLPACAGSRAHASDASSGWTAERCQDLLDQRDASMWAATFSGGLAGVGGLATAFPADSTVRLGLGISAAVVAAAATSLTVLARMKSSEFESYCGTGVVSVVGPLPEEVK